MQDTRFDKQRFAGDRRFDEAERMAFEKIEKEKKKERFLRIKKLEIGKGDVLKLREDYFPVISKILQNGIILFNDGKEIDPLDFKMGG